MSFIHKKNTTSAKVSLHRISKKGDRCPRLSLTYQIAGAGIEPETEVMIDTYNGFLVVRDPAVIVRVFDQEGGS